MIRVLKPLLLCLMSLFPSIGLAQEPIIYQPEQMQADLNKFQQALAKIHPGTFTHQSPLAFEKLVNHLLLEISKPMGAVKFYRTVLKLVASINDGHTQAYPFGKLGRLINSQDRLPFQVYVRDERIFIVKNMSSQDIPLGSELLALNDHLSNEILLEVSKHYSADGKSRHGLYHWLGGPYRPFNRLYPEVFGEKATHQLVYRDYGTKKIKSIQVKAISKETYDKIAAEKYPLEKSVDQAFNFSVDRAHAFAYLKISRFFKDSFDEPENTYPDFYRKCFEEIAGKKIPNLIIDLRDNGGGKTSNAAYLLQYFLDQPVTPTIAITTLGNDAYFSKFTTKALNLNASFALSPTHGGRFAVTNHQVMRDLMEYVPVKEFPFKGRLIVLINGGTTSAAGIAAGLLRQHTDAIFCGEETYGYAGISNGVRHISIRGEQTEVAIQVPLLHSEHQIDKSTRKRGVVPDFQVSKSVQDILNKKDPVMAFVSKHLLAPKEKRP